MKGLYTSQVDELLNKYGQNILTEQHKKNILQKLFEQFNNFLTILLIFAAVFSFLINEPIDGILIIAIVVLNALFGIYQEEKAEESIAALKKMTVTKVRVIRDGKEQEIDSRFLVPGDVVFIDEGTKISADGKVIESINLELNEAVLTGESLSVSKKIKDMVFSGTIVVKGRGLMEITHTGMQTEFGKIATNLSLIEETSTPLQKKLSKLTRLIGIVGIVLAIVVFILSLLQGTGYLPAGRQVFQAFLLAISLAVAVVPEGLPAVMTITLAIGVNRMANKKAIIRKLSAIEALGSITLIATDKTGTLTTNKMKVNHIYVDRKIYDISVLPSLQNHAFNLLILNGILCSTTTLSYVQEQHSYDVLGDPTEGALLYLAQEVDMAPEVIKKEWKLLNESPFDSITKMMSVVVSKDNKKYMFSKGAPELILAQCDTILFGKKEEKFTEHTKGEIEKQVEHWARKGLRVLGFSYNKVFLGLVAIHDAPRPEIVDAVKRAHLAGIKTVMITGDNEITAEAVGKVAGLISSGDMIMNGADIDRYTDDELLVLIPKVKIFARTNPFQKHRIVKLFQALGEIVAVTGDGVNDAIALKQADVGVAMGLIGTDVARETADMVITDDNFATIVNAVEEGRNIIKNLKNAVQYLLSCNISEAIALVVGLVLGIPTLFYAIQLLYINLVTDGFPALALAFSPRNPHSMESSPDKNLNLLTYEEKVYICIVGIISAILVLFSYFIFNMNGSKLGYTAAFSILTLIQSFILIDLWLSHRSLHKNIILLKKPIFIIAFIVPFFLQYMIVKNATLSHIFKVTPVSTFTFFQFVFVASLVLVGIKGVKKLVKM